MQQFFKIQKERAIRTYYRFRWWSPFWLYILNGRNHHLYQRNKVTLTDEQKRIVSDLGENGIASSNFQTLLGETRWAELSAHIGKLLEHPKTREQLALRKSAPVDPGDKYFNINLWNNQTADLTDPFVRFSIDDTLLAIANSYMDMWVKWRGGRLWATLPVPPGAPAHASQRWHRDPEDTKMLKVFVYFNDIDEESGPFQYVQKSHLGGKWRALFPQIPPIGSYPPFGAVESKIPPEDIRVMTAKAGTIIFCDTSGLHKGGYAKSKPRYMSQTVYASRASQERITYSYPPGSNYSKLSQAAQYALHN